MATVADINKAKSGINMMEAYGMVNANLSALAVYVLGTVAEAAHIDAALDQAIAKWEMEIAATADWSNQNRYQYTLDTLKGLK
jgi:hypothetical protein